MKKILLLPLLFLVGCNINDDQKVAEKRSVEIKIQVDRPPELIALKYIGLDEVVNRDQLKKLVGVDPVKTEWCAAFINSILSKAGIPGSESVSDNPLTARSFLSWGVKVNEPVIGDIVVFPRGTEDWQGHVGFYIRTQIINGKKYYYILGGNQNNSVSIKLYQASKAIGIRRYAH